MKHLIKIKGFAAITVVLVFSFSACKNGSTDPCAGGHSGVWVITSAPTKDVVGLETWSCSGCSKTDTRNLTVSTLQEYFYNTWKNADINEVVKLNVSTIQWDNDPPIAVTWTLNDIPYSGDLSGYIAGFRLTAGSEIYDFYIHRNKQSISLEDHTIYIKQ